MDLHLQEKLRDSLKFLSVDMIEQAGSGHPGSPLGMADFLSVLFWNLCISPTNPNYLNRDRLIFSGGHCSALAYSFLHLCGFDISLDDLRNFRQLHSSTPGHLEYPHTSGVEITTGPLGQGIANAVGLALARRHAKRLLDEVEGGGGSIISHKIYCFCGDGDLQEGISYESCSLAGHLGLSDLILIYDANGITIEGELSLAFSEDVKSRFIAQGWHVIQVDGHNFIQIEQAIKEARAITKPVLIISHSIIGKGALELEGSAKTHGAPLGSTLLKRMKEAQNYPTEPFIIDPAIKAIFSSMKQRADLEEKIWNDKLSALQKELLDELLFPNFSAINYESFNESMPTRSSNGVILNAISREIKGFLGGSADLAPSNNTKLEEQGANIHYGIREHAMGGITNGIARYGLFIPFCATFLVFSDYMLPAIRLSAMMRLRCFYIFTHDSIGVGEDGPTHQPIEQLSHLRAIPNLYTFRPADANENILCWKIALSLNAPCAFILSRQKLALREAGSHDVSTHSSGFSFLRSYDSPNFSILASGSEVHLALEVSDAFKKEGININVASVFCFDLMIEHKEKVKNLFNRDKTIAIEASRASEYYYFAAHVHSLNSFGLSGKGALVFNHFGFSANKLIEEISKLL